MIRVRQADQRGGGDYGWLTTRYTFSFNRYVDRAHMGFRSLRVINEDRVAPGQGFGTHPHDNMEIITCVLEGQLEHKDSLGTGSVIRKGEFQRMSAGTGVTHSEFNPSADEETHLYQIWILPEKRDIAPSYEQRDFSSAPRNSWVTVAAPSADGDAMIINQDAKLYLARLDAGQTVTHFVSGRRAFWLQIMSGNVALNDIALDAGDGASSEAPDEYVVQAETDSEILLFDLA